MPASNIPTILEPEKPPMRPNINMNDVAMPRYFVGKRFTATAITIFADEQQPRKRTKLVTVESNSVKMFSEKHAEADNNIQKANKCIINELVFFRQNFCD